jgi:hypothetical protein
MLSATLQAGDLPGPGIGRLAPGGAAQGFFGTLIPLTAPFGEEGGVQALPAQQRPFSALDSGSYSARILAL